MCDQKSTSAPHQVILFRDMRVYPPQKALAVCALNMQMSEWSQKAVTVWYNQTYYSIPKKFRVEKLITNGQSVKVTKYQSIKIK
jgi:hypothetical protein